MYKSVHGIIYTRDRISGNYGITVETSVVYTNSQFPSFLVDEHDGVIVLRCTGLYPAFSLGILAVSVVIFRILFYIFFADCGEV